LGFETVEEADKEVFRHLVKKLDLQVFEGGVRDRFLVRKQPHEIARDL